MQDNSQKCVVGPGIKPAIIAACVVWMVVLSLMPQAAHSVDARPSLEAVEQAIEAGDWEAALSGLRANQLVAWNAMPLTAGATSLVMSPALGFGQYTPRRDNVFERDEPILLYVELRGYSHRRRGPAFVFGVTADFELRSVDGQVLGTRDGFLVRNIQSAQPNMEFYVDLKYTVRGVPSGSYVIVTRFRDNHSDKAMSLETPIVIQ